MADLFVDTVVGASSQYDPVARLATGGTYNSYATIAAAHTAAQAGDTIYLRSGGETIVNFTTTKAVKWRAWKDEIYVLTSTSTSTTAPFTCTTVACDADFGLGQLHIRDNGQSLSETMPAVRLGFAGSKVHGIRFNWNNGCLVTLVNAGTCTMDRCILINSTHLRGFNNASSGGTLEARAWLFVNSNGLAMNAGNMTINMRNPMLIGTQLGAQVRKVFEATSTGLGINVFNPISIGNNVDDLNRTRAVLEQSGTAALTITGGVIHHHLHSRSLRSVGTVSNTASADAFVKFNQSNPCYVAICLQDSSWATTEGADGGGVSTLTAMLSMLASRPHAKLCYFPDDHQYWNAGNVAQMQAWIAAGHELNSWGISGSDDWGINTPFTASYSGGETNVRIVITNSGQNWSVVADSGTLASYDCSLTGPWRDLGVYNAVNNSGGAVAVLRQMELDISGLTITLGPGNSGTGGFDDAAASMIADGTYTLPASPPIDRARRRTLEIDRSRDLTYQHLGVYPRVFYCNGTVNNTDVGTHCQNSGWTGLLDNGLAERLRQRLDTFNPFGIYRGLGNSAATDLFGTSEPDIRAGARVLASWGCYYGAFIPIVFTNVNPLTPTQFGYLIDELTACGVTVTTFADAIAARNSISIPTRTDYRLADDSAGAGTSTRFWPSTDPRPTGANGEAFPDIGIDCGACPGHRGIFHPAKR